jgi:flagellar biosynthesis protein FlhG
MNKEPVVDQAENLRALVGGPRVLAAPAVPRPPLRVIAVTSGKGGVGKTNVTANLAVLAARAGRRVLIIDADLGLTNVEIVFGLKPQYHLGDVLEGSLGIADVLIEGPYGIRILPGSSGVQSLTRLDSDGKRRFLAALDAVEDSFDLVLVDTGAGIGDNVLFFVGAAQEALLVVSAEPTSLVDAYTAVKVLSQQAGVRHFNVVVNSVVDELPARQVFHKLTAVTSRFLEANMRHLGYVPRDENVHRAIMVQRALVDAYPKSPASRALTVIAEKLFNGTVPPLLEGGFKIMWSRLLREATPSHL